MPTQLQLARSVTGYRRPRIWLRTLLLLIVGVPAVTTGVIAMGYVVGAMVRVLGGGP